MLCWMMHHLRRQNEFWQPYGLVLGPLLYLAYINNLPEIVGPSIAKLLADDNTLLKVIRNSSDSNLLKKYLSVLETRENTWQVSFNPTNCVVLRIALKSYEDPKSKLQTELTLTISS